MFFTLTRGNVAALKRRWRDKLGFGSSHADEIIARGLGFGTYAALTPMLRDGGKDAPTVWLHVERASERANELGYPATGLGEALRGIILPDSSPLLPPLPAPANQNEPT
jgi:hypothetical protein